MLILILVVTLIIVYLAYFEYNRRKLPPGPIAFPFIGNFLQLGWAIMYRKQTIPDAMKEWVKIYGPVFTLWLGPLASVCIADYDIAYDAMVKKGSNFTDRNMPAFVNILSEGKGIVFSNGDFWQEQRRFSLHILRNLGLGRNRMEHHILEEIRNTREDVDQKLAEHGGRIIMDPRTLIESILLNTINRLIFNNAFSEESMAEFLQLKKDYDALSDKIMVWDLLTLSAYGRNRNIPFVKERAEKLLKPNSDVKNFIRKQLAERKEAIASGLHTLGGDEGEDYVDSYLIQINKEKEAGRVDSTFNDESLVFNVLDLWLAGKDTTDLTLRWSFTYLLLHPEVLQRVQDEIHCVTGGGDRPLCMSDRQATPLLNATILEILRVSSLSPLNLTRDTSEDTVVGGHLVPKGTSIAAQPSLIMSDERHFPEPKTFDPDRFITNPELEKYVVPFGIGKRACIGEAMARSELYLVLGNMVQYYNLSTDAANPPDMKAIDETTRKPKHFNLVIEKFIHQ